MSDDYREQTYDEAFIERAVAIAHARSRSLSEVAVSLSIPAELLESWKKEYESKVDVRYLKDKHLNHKRVGLPFFSNLKEEERIKMVRCPKCNSEVVFDPIKVYEVQREEGVDIGTHNSIMDSGDDGILGFENPYTRITSEVIVKCPVCGLYTIQNITEKLPNSEVR